MRSLIAFLILLTNTITPAAAFASPAAAPRAAVPRVASAVPVAAAPPVAAGPQMGAPSAAGEGGWGWPVEGGVVRPFLPGSERWLPGHRGVDLLGEAGQPVRAAGQGTVHFAGWVVSRPVVSIAHGNGTRTTYEPVEPIVAAGQTVVTGQIIGTLLAGHAGCPGDCLHWGLREGDDYLDPLILLGRARVRLLPVARRASHRRAGRSRRDCCRSVR